MLPAQLSRLRDLKGRVSYFAGIAYPLIYLHSRGVRLAANSINVVGISRPQTFYIRAERVIQELKLPTLLNSMHSSDSIITNYA